MGQLKNEVAAKYNLIGIRPGKYNFKGFGELDLRTLSVAQVDSLVSRGFTHFKLREGFAAAAPAAKTNLKAKTIMIPGKTGGVPVEDLRKNKQFVNKLLTMDWKDLSFQDRMVFFNDQRYFLEKKSILLTISSLDAEMKSLHAKAKAIKSEPENKEDLKGIMQEIADKEESKIQNWGKIDAWEQPSGDTDQIAKDAAAAALDKDKLIKANKIFILRAEKSLPQMPSKTVAEKKRKEHKAAEVARRKAELIELGSPYDGKK
jgi:hypothetical protein